MANKIAASAELAPILESQLAVTAREDDRRVEVDQVRVVRAITLCRTDAVGIVARAAGRVLAVDVLTVLPEAIVIENTVTAHCRRH